MVDGAEDHLAVQIGEEIQHLRLHKGLSQADLGAAIGVAPHQIQSYEAGRSSLSVTRLCAIAEALDVDPAHFLRVRRSLVRMAQSLPQPGLDEIGPLSKADLALAAKIARIRDDPGRRDIIASIERLADAMTKSEAQMTVAGVTAGQLG